MPTVKTLNRTGAGYLKDKRALYWALYRSGHELEKFREVILPKRPAELESWYASRLKQFHYMPRAGQILDELAGTVFAGDLEVLPKAGEEDGGKRPDLGKEYVEFFRDPMGGDSKTKLVDMLYDGVVFAQVHREHFYRVVFPDVPVAPGGSRSDQEKLGGLRPKVRHLHRDSVLDYEEDESGLLWVKTYRKIEDRDPLLEDEKRKDRHRWEIITRQNITAWQVESERDKAPDPEQEAALVEGPTAHRWAAKGRIPIVRLCLGEKVWLMDRIGSLVVAETRKRNSLDWYEELACYPQPIHKGEETINEKRETDPNSNTARGATVWLEGGKDDEFEYLEPGGSALPHLTERIEKMGHEIATVVHQAASAVGPEAARQVESAASKVRDSVAKRLLASAYADDVKKAAVEIAELAAMGRGDQMAWEALGLDDFDIGDVQAATDEALNVQAVQIGSETFHREYQKTMVRRVMPGKPTKIYEAIDAEIDNSPVQTAQDRANREAGLDEDGNPIPDPSKKDAEE